MAESRHLVSGLILVASGTYLVFLLSQYLIWYQITKWIWSVLLWPWNKMIEWVWQKNVVYPQDYMWANLIDTKREVAIFYSHLLYPLGFKLISTFTFLSALHLWILILFFFPIKCSIAKFSENWQSLNSIKCFLFGIFIAHKKAHFSFSDLLGHLEKFSFPFI